MAFHQHFGGIGVNQAGSDGKVFNPQFFQFKINGLTMYTNHSNMAARFHDVLAHIPSRRDTDRFDGAIYAIFADDSGNLLAHIAGSRVDGMGRAQFFRQFQAIFKSIRFQNYFHGLVFSSVFDTS